MIATLTIHKVTEESFKKHCTELDIPFRCVKEGIDGDQWEVEFEFISDIYSLGQMVGTDSVIDRFSNRI